MSLLLLHFLYVCTCYVVKIESNSCILVIKYFDKVKVFITVIVIPNVHTFSFIKVKVYRGHELYVNKKAFC